ncbi:GNAT family N-acetyltransferase [Babesia caballi]|uniref:GNAT family N-acetyltransferase n=1 Tax=Babesia caballi TaxID=5871 RepID=A0AAV4LWC0_BABCB|nr:GNAT family N-acetyltransferase [Babesia caballi]
MNAFKQILFLLAGCVASNISLVAADAPAKKDGTPAEWVDLVKKASTKIEGMIAELKKNKNYKDTTGTKTAVDAFATKFEDFKKEVVKVEEAKKTLDAKGKGEHKVETEAVVTAGETAITSLEATVELHTKALKAIATDEAKTVGKSALFKYVASLTGKLVSGFSAAFGFLPAAVVIAAATL